jgi:hypothetical protein
LKSTAPALLPAAPVFPSPFSQQVKADFLNPVKLLSRRKPLHYLANPLLDRITISFADASEAMG